LGTIAEKLASHFESPTIRFSQAGETGTAHRWIQGEAST
jgi:hypothetical protein